MKLSWPIGLLAALAASGAPGAHAAPPAAGPERSPLGPACRADLKKLCPDVKPGDGRIAACLKGKRDQLSPACKADLAERAAGGAGPAPLPASAAR